MKDLESQISFIDTKLIQLFGIKSLSDYNTVVYLDEITKTLDIKKINNVLPELKEVFPVKDFNFHKTENKIISAKHALNVLKTCFDIAMIPYEYNHNKKRKYLRLISSNIVLYKYIMQNQKETSEKRTIGEYIQTITNVGEISHHTVIKNVDLVNNIKKEHTVEFFFGLDTIYDTRCDEIRIALTSLVLGNVGIKNVQMDLISDKIRNSDIISEKFISDLINNPKLKLLNTEGDKGTLIPIPIVLGTKIFPNDFIFPLQMCTHHDMILTLGNISELKKISTLLTLKLTVNIVDFYAEMNKKLESGHQIEIEMGYEDGLKNAIRTMGGMWGFKWSEFSNPDKLKMKKDDNLKLDGNIVTLNTFTGFKITHPDKNVSVEYALKLIGENKYEFVSYDSKFNNIKYYVKKSGPIYEHVYNFNLVKDCDTISNISIIGQMNEKINKDDISFTCISNPTNKISSYRCNVDKLNKKVNTLFIISLPDNVHNNLFCSSSLYLSIETKSILKPFEITNSECCSYFWKKECREQIAKKCQEFIDLNNEKIQI